MWRQKKRAFKGFWSNPILAVKKNLYFTPLVADNEAKPSTTIFIGWRCCNTFSHGSHFSFAVKNKLVAKLPNQFYSQWICRSHCPWMPAYCGLQFGSQVSLPASFRPVEAVQERTQISRFLNEVSLAWQRTPHWPEADGCANMEGLLQNFPPCFTHSGLSCRFAVEYQRVVGHNLAEQFHYNCYVICKAVESYREQTDTSNIRCLVVR